MPIAYGSWKINNPLEFYSTPANATLALLSREKFSGITWEPGCGDGAISRLLPGEVLSTDLADYGYGIPGIDFLSATLKVDNIVTNPPYSKKIPFILHALEFAKAKVAMLMEQRFLEGKERKPLFDLAPPRTVYILRNRLSFGRYRARLWGHAWLVWDIGYRGKTTLEWLDN